MNHPRRSERWLRWVAVCFVAAVLFFLGAVAQHYVIEEKHHKWNPLGAFPVQNVLNPGHIVKRGGTVEVVGKQCVTAKGPVVIHGRKTWQLVIPPGTFVPDGGGRAVRQHGCTTMHFENVIPPRVAQRAADICHATGVPSIWTIAGVAVPTRHSEEGVPRSWVTEPFKLAC